MQENMTSEEMRATNFYWSGFISTFASILFC